MTTKQDIAALEAQLKSAKEAYHRNLLTEVEQLNARLKEIDDELGDPAPKVTINSILDTIGAMSTPAKPAPKNALRLVKPTSVIKPRKNSQVRDSIIDILGTGPANATEIADAIDRDYMHVWKHLQRLVKSGAVHKDNTHKQGIYSLAAGVKPATAPTAAAPINRGISTGQMETLTALASGPASVGTLASKLNVSNYSVLGTLRHLKKRGLVRELSTTWPRRWEMVQGASAGVAK